MKSQLIYPVIFFLLILVACSDVDTIIKYQACCGIEPVEFVQDSYSIFIPNCFTPNGDGINDIFWPCYNANIAGVNYIEIYDVDKSNSLIYFERNLSAPGFFGWNGYDKYYNKHIGKFDYKIGFITNGGQEIVVKGSGCSIVCGESAAIFYKRKACYFPSQCTMDGNFDISFPAEEPACFNH